MLSSGFHSWLRDLASPRMPGMGVEALRARALPVVLMLVCIALQTVLRYQAGFLPGSEWQTAHVLIGLAMCAALLVCFHGVGCLRQVQAQTWMILGSGIFLFCMFWHFGRIDFYRQLLQPRIDATGHFAPLYGFLYFASAVGIVRLLLAFLLARLLLGLHPADLGANARHNPFPPAVQPLWPVYVLLFIAVLPFVAVASQTAEFQARYPLAFRVVQPDGNIPIDLFLGYELAYLMFFASIEIFWRGFLVFGMERDLGVYGLVFMVVPYVSAHYGKPMPEALGAIVAGIVLGWLALKHRSVWLGVALHYGVALTMDLLAIQARGLTLG